MTRLLGPFLLMILTVAPASAQNPIGNGSIGYGTPSSASMNCSAGAVMFDLSYKYFCISGSTWVREVLNASTWSAINRNAYYVAASGGSDSNPGTLAQPFATLGKCQTAMQASGINKTCYIRSGTYTKGAGYTEVVTVLNSFGLSSALHLSASDNGETWSYYPPDGYNTAIIDGGCTVTTCQTTGCTSLTTTPVCGGTERAIVIEGGSNITVNGLQFRQFGWGGILIHGGPASDYSDCINENSGTFASNNLIENNIIHDTYPAAAHCHDSGQATGVTPANGAFGQAQNNTFTHNVIYNINGAGLKSGAGESGNTSESISGTTYSYNHMYNINTAQPADSGTGFYMGNPNGSVASTNLTITFNYINNYGLPTNFADTQPGIYLDDGLSNATVTGNIVVGRGSHCFTAKGQNNVFKNNICDVPSTDVTAGHQYGFTANNVGTDDVLSENSIMVANYGSACSGCMWGNGGGNTTAPIITNNAYYNYGAAGTSAAWVSGSSQYQDTNPTNPLNPQFVTCPTGLNSWGYVIGNSLGTGVFASPVSFPAQPPGWASPGFWGPPGYVIPHTGTTPSYGPTC